MARATWTVNTTQPELSGRGEYKELGEAVVLASNTGGSLDYVTPAGRNVELLRMGLSLLIKAAGFDTVHIHQKKGEAGERVDGVYTIWATRNPVAA